MKNDSVPLNYFKDYFLKPSVSKSERKTVFQEELGRGSRNSSRVGGTSARKESLLGVT